jgi:glycosyltransferase involved in cell wall biosynthesis
MKKEIKLLISNFSNKRYEAALSIAVQLKEQGVKLGYLDNVIKLCNIKINNTSYGIEKYGHGTAKAIFTEDQGISLIDIAEKNSGNKYQEVIRRPGDHILSGVLGRVSVVIPVYNRNKILSMTLAALTHQTYPLNLMEVIVVDDGSVPGTMDVIKKFETLLDIKYFWHPDKGYRPGQARTAGMKLAKSENIITLDCDMMPTKHLVAEFMYILNRHRDRVLIGPRRYVCTDHLDVDDLIDSPYWIDTLPDVATNNNVATGNYMGKKTVDWRHNFYRRTDFLKNSIFPFIAFASGNVAYPREAFLATNGYDEEFEKWGSEDTEFGYRLFAKGYYMQPVMGALALHQEPPGGENEVDRKSGYVTTKDILKEKCPLYSRDYEAGRSYSVPKFSFINSSDLSFKEFVSYINSFEYADSVTSDQISTFFDRQGIQKMLENDKASFFVVVNKENNQNIPLLIDTELKNLDQDLQSLINKVNQFAGGDFNLVWRGQLERYINFKGVQ